MTRRRFVAGAVCPRCAAVDRIVLEDSDRRRRCIVCGFTDELPAGPEARVTPLGKLDGRSQKNVRAAPETRVRIVTIVDKPSERSRDDET